MGVPAVLSHSLVIPVAVPQLFSRFEIEIYCWCLFAGFLGLVCRIIFGNTVAEQHFIVLFNR